MASAPLQLTTRRDLAVAALAGGIIAWMLVATVRLVTKSEPLLPWTGPAVLWFIALVVLVTAIVASRRFRHHREDVQPEQAVTFLVIGKTGALAGAIVGAGYLVFAAMYVGDVAIPGPRERVIRGGVAALAGVVTMLSGWWLERQCQVPGGRDDADGDSEPDPGVAD